MELVPDRVRQIKPNEVAGYHQPIQINIAWFPYEQQALERTSKNEWKVVKGDPERSGNVPVILITYPERQDTIWLDMNTKNEVLGRILKHSLMTQEPISRPLGDFIETASCSRCHPSDVAVDFNN